jgi:hypothetical protein
LYGAEEENTGVATRSYSTPAEVCEEKTWLGVYKKYESMVVGWLAHALATYCPVPNPLNAASESMYVHPCTSQLVDPIEPSPKS